MDHIGSTTCVGSTSNIKFQLTIKQSKILLIYQSINTYKKYVNFVSNAKWKKPTGNQKLGKIRFDWQPFENLVVMLELKCFLNQKTNTNSVGCSNLFVV